MEQPRRTRPSRIILDNSTITETKSPSRIRPVITAKPYRNPKLTILDRIHLLPKEIIGEFAQSLTCQEIKDLSLVDPKFAKFANENNLVTKARDYHYPRVEGYAEVFSLLLRDDNYRFLYKDKNYESLGLKFKRLREKGVLSLTIAEREILDKIRNEYPEFDDVEFVDDFDIDRISEIILEESDKIFNRNIYEANALPIGIVRGDMIVGLTARENDSYIFDGCHLIKLNKDSTYLLPKQFQVIKDNVPVNYWGGFVKYVRFDHRPYRRDIINNAKSVLNADENNIVTESNFLANGKEYIIRSNIPIHPDDDIDVIKSLIPTATKEFTKLFRQQLKFIPLQSKAKFPHLLIVPYFLETLDVEFF